GARDAFAALVARTLVWRRAGARSCRLARLALPFRISRRRRAVVVAGGVAAAVLVRIGLCDPLLARLLLGIADQQLPARGGAIEHLQVEPVGVEFAHPLDRVGRLLLAGAQHPRRLAAENDRRFEGLAQLIVDARLDELAA